MTRNLVGRSPAPKNILGPVRYALIAVAVVSGVLNVLALTGSFFMLLVYDRVLPSHSLETLAGLIAIVVILYAFQALLELSRQKILVQLGAALDVRFSRRVYEAATKSEAARTGDGLQISRDLDQVRGFVSGPGPSAFFDLPWMVLYIGICFLFHWLIGVTALAGAAVLVGLTFLTERLTRASVGITATELSRRNVLLLSGVQNAEAVRALGMDSRLKSDWGAANDSYLISQQRSAGLSGGLSAVTRTFRMFLQSGVLALGAYLVIKQQATGGVIIAASILTARSLAPVEQAIANLRGFIGFRQSWARLRPLADGQAGDVAGTQLPPPVASVAVEGLAVAAPGGGRLLVEGAKFGLKASAGLAIIGASGSGKSSLVKAIAGAWPVASGTIRLDGAAMDQWRADDIGAHIGYLPQNVQLLSGTIAQNIARFDAQVRSDEVISAATAAGVHQLVVSLPNGYETLVGSNGAGLSAGQAQRIALARALFRDPFLVVLDEPNSNLDLEGEAALHHALVGARRRGAIVIVVAHRPSALAALDQMLVMANGRVQMFGPKEAVLKRMIAGQQQPLASALQEPEG